MIYVVDTNVLLRYADRADALHAVARRAIAELRQEHELRSIPQNLIEFWNVMTRPAERNGFGIPPSEAQSLLDLTERLFPPLDDLPDVYSRWKSLVVRFDVSGVQVHDARLAAAMLAHDVRRILTFNGRDFQRYAEIGIQAFDPRKI